ncbi:MAG: thermostable hemolysin [Proteobacteria bacterium]|nr:thermostable hemolysin [Pseudomonadota bacterium]
MEAAYIRAFRARPSRHYPILLSVRAGDGEVLAAAGLRRAVDEPLFLERYLDVPVEAACRRAFGEPVDRSAILEIGGLASKGPSATARLFEAVARFAVNEGAEVAIATMTGRLRRKFQRHGVALHEIQAALPERLGEEAAAWGGYYDHDPRVVAGRIALPAAAFARGECAA